MHANANANKMLITHDPITLSVNVSDDEDDDEGVNDLRLTYLMLQKGPKGKAEQQECLKHVCVCVCL